MVCCVHFFPVHCFMKGTLHFFLSAVLTHFEHNLATQQNFT